MKSGMNLRRIYVVDISMEEDTIQILRILIFCQGKFLWIAGDYDFTII